MIKALNEILTDVDPTKHAAKARRRPVIARCAANALIPFGVASPQRLQRELGNPPTSRVSGS
jgi:hypothetical protein